MAQQDAHLSWALKGVMRGLLKGGLLYGGAVVGADGMEGTRLTSKLLEVFSLE